MNNEIKVRRSIKLIILEKTKIISYENLKEIRAKRATKKKAITRKEKRDAKRKSSTSKLKSKTQTSSSNVVTNSSMSKKKVTRISKVELAKILEAS